MLEWCSAHPLAIAVSSSALLGYDSAAGHRPDIFQFKQTERVYLPHLEELALTGPISWAIALLTQLELPKSTVVRLECHCDDSQDICRLLAFIPDQVSNHPSMTGSAQTAF